jgi:hypothetical protein
MLDGNAENRGLLRQSRDRKGCSAKKGFMRKWILSLALALTSVLSFAQVSPEVKEEQHRATVTIVMKGKTEGAGCSATAIAEHVLLTAEHCDIPDGVVYLNQTEAPFIHPLEVSDRIFDKQDHMLLVLPQVSFKHTIPYDPNNYVPLKKGDHYYLWGNPGLIPDQYREGYVTGSFTPPKDSLEADVQSPFALISGPVVGGDSGSAIFTSDGHLAGVLTWGIFGGSFAGIYPLAFTTDQLNEAKGMGNFVYIPDTRPISKVTVLPTPVSVIQSAESAEIYLEMIVLMFAVFLLIYAKNFMADTVRTLIKISVESAKYLRRVKITLK